MTRSCTRHPKTKFLVQRRFMPQRNKGQEIRDKRHVIENWGEGERNKGVGEKYFSRRDKGLSL